MVNFGQSRPILLLSKGLKGILAVRGGQRGDFRRRMGRRCRAQGGIFCAWSILSYLNRMLFRRDIPYEPIVECQPVCLRRRDLIGSIAQGDRLAMQVLFARHQVCTSQQRYTTFSLLLESFFGESVIR